MPEAIWYNADMKPFKYGCVVTGETFCPRPDLQKRLATCVKDGQLPISATVSQRRRHSWGRKKILSHVH